MLPRGPQIPLLTVIYLGIASAVTVVAHQFPEAAGPLSLGLGTFLTLDRRTGRSTDAERTRTGIRWGPPRELVRSAD